MAIKSDNTPAPLPPPSPPPRPAWRQALPQVLAVSVKNVLLLGFGMTLGFPTILIPSLSGNNPDEVFSLGQEAISWIGSINLICVPVGCLLSGVITQPIGRKRAMQFVNLPFLAAWLLFHFATEVWHVFFALCLTGLTGGLLEAPVLTYVAEISQSHLRGRLAATSTACIILGTLLSFLVGTFFHWRTVALISMSIPVLATFLLMFVPETPLWLISKNRHLDAKKSLAWLRGWVTLDEIEEEYRSMCKNLNTTYLKRPSMRDKLGLLSRRDFVRPLLLVSFAFFLLHFNGVSTLQTYAIDIFATLKSPIDEHYATNILGGVQFLGCITCVTLVGFIGRRNLNFVTMVACGLCFIVVATYAYLTDVHYFINFDKPSATDHVETLEEDDRHDDWISLTFLILSAYLSTAGVRSLPWILVGEVFSNEMRAMGSGICAAIGYLFGFLSNKIFLSMVASMTLPGTFWFYASINLLGTVILYFCLPETEGKSLEYINEHFAGNLVLERKAKQNSQVKKINGHTTAIGVESKSNTHNES